MQLHFLGFEENELFLCLTLFCSCIQIVVWRFLHRSKGSDVLATKQALLFIILFQYVPRFLRMVPLTSELKRTAGVFAETAWEGAAYYLLLYMLASHVSSYFLSVMFAFVRLPCLVLVELLYLLATNVIILLSSLMML